MKARGTMRVLRGILFAIMVALIAGCGGGEASDHIAAKASGPVFGGMEGDLPPLSLVARSNGTRLQAWVHVTREGATPLARLTIGQRGGEIVSSLLDASNYSVPRLMGRVEYDESKKLDFNSAKVRCYKQVNGGWVEQSLNTARVYTYYHSVVIELGRVPYCWAHARLVVVDIS